jgi:uncharacterized membrane protein YgcG
VILLDRTDRALGDRVASHRFDEQIRVEQLALRARAKSVWPARLRWATFALSATAAALWWFADSLDVLNIAIILCGALVIVGSIVVWIVATPPLALTRKGADARDHLRGLRDYIRLAEADRIRVLQSPGTAERIDVTDRSAVVKLYENLLPFAMIWGLEKEWIGQLAREYEVTVQPDWYSGTSQLAGLAVFTSAIGSAHFATSTSSSSDSSGGSSGSSSSGGSDGGGSAGGGDGGGGGGGW